MTELSYAMAVLSSFTYGAADFLGGLAAKRSALFSVVIFSQLSGLVLVLCSLPVLPPASPNAVDFAWGSASGLAGGIGLALLYRGLAVGVMSIVAPVTAVCSVIIPIMVGVILGERPTVSALIGIVLSMVAIVLVTKTGFTEPAKPAATGLSIAVASGIAIGFFLVCLGRTGPSAGLWPLIAARVVSVSFFTIAGLISRQKLLPSRESIAIVVFGGALDMGANILYLLAVRQAALSMVATLTSLYPASTIILARIVLHERLTLMQQVGVACVVIAIALIVSG